MACPLGTAPHHMVARTERPQVRIGAAFLILAAASLAASAQSISQPQSRPVGPQGITAEQAAKIIQELQMIRMLLQEEVDAQARGPQKAIIAGNGTNAGSSEVTLHGLGAKLLGQAGAPLTLVEFVDLQCPFCIEFHNETFPELKRKYIDTGELRFAVLEFPLPSHVYADAAAEMAECAARQGGYWKVYDAFLSAPLLATSDVIRRMAGKAGLDFDKLASCMNSSETADDISQQVSEGKNLGVVGTPTFLLGRTFSGGVRGDMIEGAPPWTALDARIQTFLRHKAGP